MRAGSLSALGPLALLVLAGCVERGDFGRVRTNSAWNDIVATTGSAAAAARGEPVSPFGLTDDEAELRGRAWRFLVPAHERSWFDRALAELAAGRVLPPGAGSGDPGAYGRGLRQDGAASATSRYRRLGEDATADSRLLPPLVDTARRVRTADGVRLRTLDHAGAVSPADIASAEARVAENSCLLAWVSAGLDDRIEGYRFALEHLVIATPQADAVPAERALTALERNRAILAGLDLPALAACGAGAPSPPGPGLAAGAPPVRKG